LHYCGAKRKKEGVALERATPLFMRLLDWLRGPATPRSRLLILPYRFHLIRRAAA
jgi:hypothetical protein